MRFALAAAAAFIGLVAATPVAEPVPQGVTASLAPSSTPQGCASSYDNGQQFQIGIVNITSSMKVKRQATPDTLPGHPLYLTLVDGTLKDQDGRVGYIAANGQLQFDNGQPQTGATITTGWSACPNSTLALASTVFYECLSGSFYNLYDKMLGDICYAVNLEIIGGSGTSSVTGATTMTSPATYTTTSAAATTSAPVYTTSSVATYVPPATTAPSNASSTVTPFTGAGSSVYVSSSWMAAVAGVIGMGAFLL